MSFFDLKHKTQNSSQGFGFVSLFLCESFIIKSCCIIEFSLSVQASPYNKGRLRKLLLTFRKPLSHGQTVTAPLQGSLYLFLLTLGLIFSAIFLFAYNRANILLSSHRTHGCGHGGRCAPIREQPHIQSLRSDIA